MQIVCAILGGALLFFGRKLYWLAVGLLGFLAAAVAAEAWMADQQLVLRVIVAIGSGILGAVIAVVFQRVAFALAGFFAGGFLALAAASYFELPSSFTPFYFTGSSIAVAILAALVMDRAIIVLTSLAGAAAIVLAISSPPLFSAVCFFIFTVAGIVFQSRAIEPREDT